MCEMSEREGKRDKRGSRSNPVVLNKSFGSKSCGSLRDWFEVPPVQHTIGLDATHTVSSISPEYLALRIILCLGIGLTAVGHRVESSYPSVLI